MKIDHLILSDFRSHEHLKLEVGEVTLVTGPNGAGKSTLAGALEFWVSGKNPYSTTREDERDSLLRHGADSGYVSVIPEGWGGEVARTIKPHKIGIAGSGSMGVRDAQARLEHIAGCAGDMARLSIRAGQFFDMTEKAQTALLYELLGVRITDDLVAAELAERVGDAYPIDEVAKRHCKEITSNLARQYEQCYKARTAVNRRLKSVKELLAADANKKRPFVAPVEGLDEAREQLQKLRDEWAQHAAAMRTYQQAEADVEAAAERVAELEGQLGDYKPGALAESRAFLEQLEQQHGDLAKLDSEKHELYHEAQLLKEKAAAMRHKPRCPECNQILPASEHSDKIKELERQASELTQKAGAPVDQKKLRDLRENILAGKEWVKKLEAHQATAAALEEARRVLADRQERLQLTFRPAPADDLKERGAELAARVKELEVQHQERQRWLEACEEAKKLDNERIELELERDCLNELVQFFGPQGLQLKVLTRCIEPLTAQLNSVLELWGLEARFELPDARLEVRRGGGWFPFRQLSDGERLVVALAHQVWFADVTGLKIVFLDRLEALDENLHVALFDAVRKLTQSGMVDHVFLLGIESRIQVPKWMTHHQLTRAAVTA